MISLFAARPSGPVVAIAALCLAAVGWGSAALAQNGDAAPAIDGIVALVGSSPGDEGSATPVLASDVALHAALAARIEGPAPAGALAIAAGTAAARRQVILLALLVREGRQSGEEIDPAARQGIVDAITANAGGADAFAALLASLGATPGDVSVWAGDVVLAIGQLSYMREQVEPPSDKDVQRRFAAADHPFVGRELKDVRSRLREIMINEQLTVALGALLGQALSDGTVRIVRP